MYGESKLANQIFGLALARKYPHIRTTMCHPGGTNTDLQRYAYDNCCLRCIMQDPEMGCLPTLRAAADDEAESGAYFGPATLSMRGPPVPRELVDRAKDVAFQERFWRASATAMGVDFPIMRMQVVMKKNQPRASPNEQDVL